MKRQILRLFLLLSVVALFYFIYLYYPKPDFMPIETTQTDTQMSVTQLPPITKIKVYKSQRYMDLLAKDTVVRRYSIRLGFTPEGHKTEEGDGKTPEGQYLIDWRNPNSLFYKSLHISYPNHADTKQASDRGLSPGGDIMIHGSVNTKQGEKNAPFYHYIPNKDWTFGCIAVSNAAMDELWLLIENGTPIEIMP